jgi:cytochrome b561
MTMIPRTRYDGVAIALHWLTVLAILAMLAMGWSMTALTPGSLLQFQLYQWHKSVGMTILALSLLRLGWRWLYRPPPLPEAMPGWERATAHLGHFGLYALLLFLPLSGWALVSASPFNIPTVLYGILPVPHLPVTAVFADKAAAEHLFKFIHNRAVWVLVVLAIGHAAAALRHHFLLRDQVLVRMLPRFGARS